MSFELKIDPKKRAASRFIGKVRKALVLAALDEKSATGMNQQRLAEVLGVNRSVINRILKGQGNITLRSVGELAWALNLEPDFKLVAKKEALGCNISNISQLQPITSSSDSNVKMYSSQPRSKAVDLNMLEVVE